MVIDGSTPRIAWTSELPGKPVDWALRVDSAGASALWALRRVEGGWCVVGTYPVGSGMTVSDRAIAGTTALALLRFESVPDRTGITTRYVALATNGERLWIPLEGKDGHELIAREARFRKQGSTLFLDVPTPSGATAVLKFDGARFVKLN